MRLFDKVRADIAETPASVLAFWRALGPDKWFTRDAEVDAAIAVAINRLTGEP
jgi:uncharacterized protein (DUF924 family)